MVAVAGSPEEVRREIAAALREETEFDVAEEPAPGKEARGGAADVVVSVDGTQVPFDTPAVIMSDHVGEMWRARRTGAAALAVISRAASLDELVAATYAVAAGLSAVAPEGLRDPSSGGFGETERLTPREVEVLRELARGSANKAIAGKLSISEHTVKFHVGSIFAKLGVSSRTEAVAHGIRLGLIML